MKSNVRLLNFFEELKQPIHCKHKLYCQDNTLKDNEFIIDSNWSIWVIASNDPKIKMVAEDLREFLQQCANVSITISYKPKYLIREIEKVIVIDGNMKNSLIIAESYDINCSNNSIIIQGADSSGLMYGVFHLEDLMNFRGAAILQNQKIERRPLLSCRIFRSPMSFYYDDNELLKINEAYPDSYLRKLAQQGFNGIWARGILRKLVKNKDFPEFGSNSKTFIISLKRLIKRCRRFGIQVYLYFTEPLGFSQNSEFFKKYEHLRGHAYGYQKSNAFCSSEPTVKSYLRKGFYDLCSQLDGLGGVILITASEHQSHCYSNCSVIEGKTVTCKKCAGRTPAEVIGEVISLINNGVKSAQRKTKVIAWNWSWSIFYADPQHEIIKKIPKDVIIMGDFERGGIKEVCGIENRVDEYSLSYVGPSERFKSMVSDVQKQGHEVFAKLQLCVTHEIATIPYWPILPKIIDKFLKLKELNCSGAMECWNFGNILSRNSELAHWYSWAPLPGNADDIMLNIAGRDFGHNVATDFVECWHIFSRASDFYPFSNEFVYGAPMNYGSAYPLYFKPVNRPLPPVWLLPSEREYNINYMCMKHTEFGDLYESCVKKLGVNKTLDCLKKMNAIWQGGLDLMRSAVAQAGRNFKYNANREYNVCLAVYCQFKSLINFLEFTKTRNALYSTNKCHRKELLLTELKLIANNEYNNSKVSKELSEKELSLGFHGEAYGYMYTPEKIDAKLKQLHHIIYREIPEYANNLR